MIQKLLIILFAILLITATLSAQVPHCKGTTVKGKPCRQTFIDSTGYCRFHNPNRILCGHTDCHNVVKQKGEFCRFHKQ